MSYNSRIFCFMISCVDLKTCCSAVSVKKTRQERHEEQVLVLDSSERLSGRLVGSEPSGSPVALQLRSRNKELSENRTEIRFAKTPNIIVGARSAAIERLLNGESFLTDYSIQESLSAEK